MSNTLTPPRSRAASPRAAGRPAGSSARPSKGSQTKASIIDAALASASRIGLEGLSIGGLAEDMGMSKSGVFAHFGSREELQLSVVRAYHEQFAQTVFLPALQAPRGLPRLRAIFANWMQRSSYELDAGCLYISGAAEFDDRPGPVRDALLAMVQEWLSAMDRAIAMAVTAGHLNAEADVEQMGFEIHALILALHHEARFLQKPGSIARAQRGFDNILRRNGAQFDDASPAATVGGAT